MSPSDVPIKSINATYDSSYDDADKKNNNNNQMNTFVCCSCSLSWLPEELLRHIISFSDIPTLGQLAQLCRTTGILTAIDDVGNDCKMMRGADPNCSCRQFVQMANENKTWATFVQGRFGINILGTATATNTQRRGARSIGNGGMNKNKPKLYGGPTWKDAYCSMAFSHRPPKSRYLATRTIFAKTKHQQNNNNKKKIGYVGSVSMWVALRHTEDCQTRRMPRGAAARMQQRRGNTNDLHRPNDARYIELLVCCQNVSSGTGPIAINVRDATLHLLRGDDEDEGDYHHHQDTTQDHSNRMMMIRQGVELDIMEFRPRLVHLHTLSPTKQQSLCSSWKRTNSGTRRRNNHYMPSKNSTKHDRQELVLEQKGMIVLNTFEYCIVSMHFACSPDVYYETDFLARACFLNMPLVPAPPSDKWGGKEEEQQPKCNANDWRFKSHDDDDGCCGMARAYFIPDSEACECYMQLPGGYLSLNNSNRAMRGL